MRKSSPAMAIGLTSDQPCGAGVTALLSFALRPLREVVKGFHALPGRFVLLQQLALCQARCVRLNPRSRDGIRAAIESVTVFIDDLVTCPLYVLDIGVVNLHLTRNRCRRGSRACASDQRDGK
jgi:hypothetical protein